MTRDGKASRPIVLRRIRRRHLSWFTAIVFLAVTATVFRPAWHLWRTARHDVDQIEPLAAGFTDDASRMNLTAVHSVRTVSTDPATAERELAAILTEADANGWKVSLAGARHSMGGHTHYPGGVVIDMRPLSAMSLDATTNILRVGSGALWRDVLAYLDPRSRSIGVMQSNDSFTVGGSISVNCHGWQVGRPPISSTVVGFRLMRADGSVVQCKRDENKELFSAVLGGYGLFGIILDVDLMTVPNRRYRLDRRIVPSTQLPTTWDDTVAAHSPATEMVYGRLNVMISRFLQDAIVYSLYIDPDAAALIPAIHEPESIMLQRQVLRGAAEDEYGKQLRWQAELKLQPIVGGTAFSRNQLLNEGVEIFQNRSKDTTDILHEYFLPRAKFGEFLKRLQLIVPKHEGNLLNVTVRSVEADSNTTLRYATEPIYSFVMLFQQHRDQPADNKMAAMTRDLIDAALDLGGRYYLPYRLHATRDQFRRGYPQADTFFELKRKYDPHELFQNQFYLKYGVPEEAAFN